MCRAQSAWIFKTYICIPLMVWYILNSNSKFKIN
jgi:hypothetical protein